MHIPHIATLIAAFAVSTPLARAQSTYVFQIQQSASNFNWSGTTSLGPIVGNPSTAFQLAGTSGLDIVAQIGPMPIASASFTGGDAFTVPDIHGKIPNPLPFLPPLATIDLVGLHMSASSGPFNVDGAGQWGDVGTLTALAGTLTVTLLGQSPTVTDLTGLTSDPGPISGVFSVTPSNIHLHQPIDSTFSFSDSSSGATGSITITGTIESDHALTASFCAGDGSSGACPCGIASV
jgi:hypothetical protein